MLYKKDKTNNLWKHGVVLSFDLDTARLKDYYSKTSPQGAYNVIKRFLKKNGFEHQQDSDYINSNIDKTACAKLIYIFAKENKWFPLCISKMNISPNVQALDISIQLKQLVDVEWEKQHSAPDKTDTMEYYEAEIAKQQKQQLPHGEDLVIEKLKQDKER